jgi:hypothetical protein
VAFLVGRSKASVEDYNVLVKWLKRAHEHFEDLGLPQIPDEPRKMYEQFMKKARPLFARLDKATGQMLLPSLDGQDGLVLDAKLKSRHWHVEMPVADKDLPLPELALLMGVKDAALFRKAFQEYRAVINELIEVVRDLAPPGIPEFKIPEPQTHKVPAGTLYSYPLPDAAGVDRQLVPTAGLSDKLAAFTLSQDHAVRLLTKTPLKVKEGPLAGAAKKQLAMAGYFDWAGFVDAAAPWFEYALAQGGVGNDVLEQVQAAVEILKVLRSHAAVTYLEQGAVVTHSETVIRDLEK